MVSELYNLYFDFLGRRSTGLIEHLNDMKILRTFGKVYVSIMKLNG
jgi:hypothetical protein